jgi:signal transduction histidine kinase/CheY-like chemotaxis protein
MERAGLDYTFVHGTWLEGLGRLESGEIDVMVDVAYSEERARVYDFNGETVIVNWGSIYSRPGLRIESFLGLEGLVVAAMEGSIHTNGEGGVLSLAKSFGIDFAYLPTENYEAAWKAVEDGKADVAVVNRIFGLEREKTGRLNRSNVFFNPISIKYAFNKESRRTARLVGAFDDALVALKADKRSAYYAALDKYLPNFIEKRSFIPAWLKVALPAIGAALCIALFFVVALSREIGFRRKVEAELVRAKEAAETANRAKGSFLANMSHEIRTPLNAVLGYAQILRADPSLRDEHRGYLDKIRNGGEHLLSVINEILDMSKIESGKTTLETASFDLHAAIREAAEISEARAKAKGLTLAAEIDAALPRFAVGDETKLRQILINLLGNAVKFTEKGSVRLRAERFPGLGGAKDGPTVRFTVSDTGIGIDPADQERIFDAFEQARASAAAREGTGLGLSISRKLARLMGGDISVSSRLGAGSEFVFTVRLGWGEAKPPVQAGVSSAESSLGRPLRVKEPTAVLVADDRESNREILVRMLEPYGFEPEEAEDGEAAYRAFAERRHGLVLLDLVMPGKDGADVLERMRALEAKEGSRSAILILTASSLEEDRPRLLAAGADYFIRKPFREADLLEAIARCVPMEREPPGPALSADKTAVAIPQAADPEELRRLAAGLDPDLRSSIVQALTIGDVGRLRELAEELAAPAPALSSAASQAAESFDFTVLAGALSAEEIAHG